MGLLDRFKKNKQKEMPTAEKSAMEMKNVRPYEIRYQRMKNGNLQIDYLEKRVDPNKFYDTTRFIVDPRPLDMSGHQIYNGAVSWYGDDDCKMLDEKTGQLDSLRATAYRGVLTEIDIRQLQTNPEYCSAVMTRLLDQKRVIEYLNDGLSEKPKKAPCGKYVGGIRENPEEPGKYQKFFSPDVGMVSHYSNLMVGRRQEIKDYNQRKRQEELRNKRAMRERLDNEIKAMENNDDAR